MMKDIQKVKTALHAYAARMAAEGKFRAVDFVAYMEPVFREAGFRATKPAGEIRKILLVRDDAAGDFVLFSPVIREIRRLYPKAHITLLVSSRNSGLAVSCPYVDDIIIDKLSFDTNYFPSIFNAELQLAETLWEHDYDLAFAGRLGIRSGSLLLMYMAGICERVGFTQNRSDPAGNFADLKWDCLLTLAVPFLPNAMHDVDRNLMLLENMLRLPVADREIEVWITDKDRQAVTPLLQPLLSGGMKRILAVAPTASVGKKRWPVERYQAVLKRILKKEKRTGLIILGGPEDLAAGEKFAAAFGRRAISLAGRLSFSESAAAVEMAALYIGNDTGLMHVAAALKKPVLSVNCFPLDVKMGYLSVPLRFVPYHVPSVTVFPAVRRGSCSDAWQHGCGADEPHCILNVTVETVLKGYEALLQKVKNGDNSPMFAK